jgi:hypothetical protein
VAYLHHQVRADGLKSILGCMLCLGITELPDHLGIAEITRGRVTSATERDRANVTLFARQGFRAHHDRYRIEAFGWLASRDGVIGGDDVVKDKSFAVWWSTSFCLIRSSGRLGGRASTNEKRGRVRTLRLQRISAVR